MPRRVIGRGTQLTPWTQSFPDYQNKAITITVNFNDSTGNITNATIVRDVGCVYSKIFIGTGVDGKPNSAPGTFAVAEGTTNFSAAQLASGGFNVIEDILQLQITAGA
jgi:hypothetical protein